MQHHFTSFLEGEERGSLFCGGEFFLVEEEVFLFHLQLKCKAKGYG
jgi:hypothetical protein